MHSKFLSYFCWVFSVRQGMLLGVLSSLSLLSVENTYNFQDFESKSVCPENWGYTGGEQTTRTSRTGANSLLVGRRTDGADSC